MTTKLVLLGIGTPNACPNACGPASAVVVDDKAYLVDFGPGVVRQAAKAYHKGIDALRSDRLTVAFCTHLHTEIQDNTKNLDAEMAWRCEAILQEIKDAGYSGKVVNGQDLDIFE